MRVKYLDVEKSHVLFVVARALHPLDRRFLQTFLPLCMGHLFFVAMRIHVEARSTFETRVVQAFLECVCHRRLRHGLGTPFRFLSPTLNNLVAIVSPSYLHLFGLSSHFKGNYRHLTVSEAHSAGVSHVPVRPPQRR